jgi:predicted transcriptional regulator
MERTISIRLPENLRKELKKISQMENKPLSQLVRESLQSYVTIKHFRKLRDRALPFAEAEGILTDEDVFKMMS